MYVYFQNQIGLHIMRFIILITYNQMWFVKLNIIAVLTLRGLSLFFKILTISNTGSSIAYILAIVHFLYPKHGSFSDMEYYFYQFAYRDSKVP